MDDSAVSPSDAILQSVKVEVLVALGTARPSMSELSALDIDSVLALDREVNDPVALYVGDRLVAEGVLEEAEDGSQDRIAVRISRIIDQGSSDR